MSTGQHCVHCFIIFIITTPEPTACMEDYHGFLFFRKEISLIIMSKLGEVQFKNSMSSFFNSVKTQHIVIIRICLAISLTQCSDPIQNSFIGPLAACVRGWGVSLFYQCHAYVLEVNHFGISKSSIQFCLAIPPSAHESDTQYKLSCWSPADQLVSFRHGTSIHTCGGSLRFLMPFGGRLP